MTKPRMTYCALGNAVPLVPYKDFSRLPREVTADLWQVIGPTVQRNLGSAPLWLIFCACYAQGLENGAALARGEG